MVSWGIIMWLFGNHKIKVNAVRYFWEIFYPKCGWIHENLLLENIDPSVKCFSMCLYVSLEF